VIVHLESKSLLLGLKPTSYATLRAILPNHSKPIDYMRHNLAVPHTLKTVKILRNMGIKAPSPIRHYYDWPRPARFTTVFEHQYATADFLTLNSRCFVLNEMGTSKTASALWAADYLMYQKVIKKVLIVSPLSTLDQVWLSEIFDVCMHRTGVILHGDAEKRKRLLASKADFYIINPDGLKIIQKELALRTDIDLVIVDEAADYRNGQNDRYGVLKKITAKRRLWMMTGAPCPNAPTDAWALARLVEPTRVPEYFSSFKRMTMNQVSTYKWVPKPGSHQIAFDALQPAIRFKKADCLSLPPVTYTNRSCGMSKEQQAAYDAMKTHLVAEAATGITVSAVNAADKISKLRQILCGAIKDAKTETYVTLPHEPRFKVLTEAIEQAAAKVLVIVPYKGIQRALNTELQDWHDTRGDGMRCEIVNGDVSPSERARIFQEFRDDATLNELVCHPKVMSHGLNMTQADMVVFYAPINSNDQSGQVMDRINRPGQTRAMTILRIVANALEQGIYAVVEGRSETQQTMLDLYKKEMMS
jgi:SNF2 family DNA or RNA helicase